MPRAVNADDEIWHRSIEDLLRVIERPQAAAPGPFAITLATSRAPFSPPRKALQFDRLHVYQLSPRTRQGSPQFRLRLGIIETDLEADAILAQVRAHYPGATKEIIEDDDRAAVARAEDKAQSAASAVGGRSNTAAPVPPVITNAPSAAPDTINESLEDSRVHLDRLLPHLAQSVGKT